MAGTERDWGSGVKLIFGVACDGRAYPDFPGSADGVLGAAVVGPRGLIEILETRMGLTAPHEGAAVRIAAYTAKLRSVLTGRPGAFFAASFARDPWATAKTLLTWRDDLILSGWGGGPVGEPRIDDLALAEAVEPPLPAGDSDRLRGVMRALEDRPQLDIEAVTHVEPLDLLPPAYRQLLDALAICAVAVQPAGTPAAGTAGNDLNRAQAFLQTGVKTPMIGDGAFITLAADTALMAAEAVAEWLAAGSEEDLAGTVVLCIDGDSALLDHALQARGLPALGQSAASPWRGALQVLPLAFAASWAPFNARALLDLLLLPQPPIGWFAARKLAKALVREPGTGGEAWKRAWADVDAHLLDRFTDHPQAAAEIDKRRKSWREWTTGGLYSRTDGMPAQAARQIANRVGQWATKVGGGTSDPLLLQVAGAASALAKAIEALGQDPLPALLIERMIEQVLADGAQNPGHVATAGGLRCIQHPAALWDTVTRLVWWDFTGPGERVRSSPWNKAELAALTAAGCRVEPPAETAARISWGYANVVNRTGERLLLVRPALSGDSATTSHPLAHQLNPVTAPAGEAVEWRAEQLLENPTQALGGRALVREAIEVLPQPRATASWSLPASAVAQLAGRHESATSFERLADCQLRWMLQDVLKLSRGQFAEIPGTDQLLGNLAHEISSRVLLPGPVADSETVSDQVAAVFDDLLSTIAAPLQQPEHAGELATARTRVPLALAELTRLLRERNLEVVGTELDRAGEFAHGLSVRGRLDLVVQHPTQGLGVIDLKWTKSAKRRREEITEGRALQLATYGAVADPEGGPPSPGAYYLLSQRRLIGLPGSIVADEEVNGAPSLDDTWTDLQATWRVWRDLAANGRVIATGMPDAQDHVPEGLGITPPGAPCIYCDLKSLCRASTEGL